MKRTRPSAAPAAATPAPAPAPTVETPPAGDFGTPAASGEASTDATPAPTDREIDTSPVAVRILRDHGDWSVNDVAELPANEVEDAEADGWACSHPESVAAAG